MDAQTRIRETVFSVLDELNEQLPAPRRLAKAESTALTGPDGPLDSLGVVNLIAVLEQKIEEQFARSVDLIDNGLLGEAEPLQSVGTLLTFVSAVLDDRPHA
jgi:acyl carrier protein